jgi:hypothetical protein
VGKLFFNLANCESETGLELPMYFCVFVGVLGSGNLPTAVFVEDMHKLFDSFHSMKCAAPGKALRSPLSDNSSHGDKQLDLP